MGPMPRPSAQDDADDEEVGEEEEEGKVEDI